MTFSAPHRLSIAIAGLALMAGSAMAAPTAGCDSGPMRAMHAQGGMDGPGRSMEGLREHRWRDLNLSDAQRDQLFELMQSQAKARHESMRTARKNHDEWRQLSQAPAFDAAKAKALADQHGQWVAQQMLQRAQFEAQVLALLTPEQRQKWQQQDSDGPRMGARGHGPQQGHRSHAHPQ